jgi:hypothetical protein
MRRARVGVGRVNVGNNINVRVNFSTVVGTVSTISSRDIVQLSSIHAKPVTGIVFDSLVVPILGDRTGATTNGCDTLKGPSLAHMVGTSVGVVREGELGLESCSSNGDLDGDVKVDGTIRVVDGDCVLSRAQRIGTRSLRGSILVRVNSEKVFNRVKSLFSSMFKFQKASLE